MSKQSTSDTTSGTAETFSASSQQGLSDAIKNGIVNVDSDYTVNVNYSGLTSINQISDAIDNVLDDNPDLDYVDSYQVQTESHYGSPTVIDKVLISVKYRFTKDQILSMEKAVNDKAQEIINDVIKPGMTDYDKELALHDYIVSHTKYDYQNYLNNTIPNESYTAYGVMVKGVGVCEGYAISMWKLLNMAGIPTLVIDGTSNGDSHAWNLVKIGENYYHLDATFDDPIVNGGAISVVDHKYFNLTDSQIAVDHSWDKSKYPACTSTEFSYK